jgi:hypothetical protein
MTRITTKTHSLSASEGSNNFQGSRLPRYVRRPLRLTNVLASKRRCTATGAFVPLLLLIACKTAAPLVSKTMPLTQTPTHYPSRPEGKPPAFHLFHQTDNTLTLVTLPKASDRQITAIIFQLRDAANSHTFDSLHLPQAFIDKRDPIVWFHVYRGDKCASEKYTSAKLPCGASYHAAGEFTLGSFKDPDHTDGELLSKPDHPTALWNPETK